VGNRSDDSRDRRREEERGEGAAALLYLPALQQRAVRKGKRMMALHLLLFVQGGEKKKRKKKGPGPQQIRRLPPIRRAPEKENRTSSTPSFEAIPLREKEKKRNPPPRPWRPRKFPKKRRGRGAQPPLVDFFFAREGREKKEKGAKDVPPRSACRLLGEPKRILVRTKKGGKKTAALRPQYRRTCLIGEEREKKKGRSGPSSTRAPRRRLRPAGVEKKRRGKERAPISSVWRARKEETRGVKDGLSRLD